MSVTRDQDEVVDQIDHAWEVDQGVLALMHDGVLDPDGMERLISLLRSLDLAEGPVDLRLVRTLWFLPVFLQWQVERAPEDSRQLVKDQLDQVVNALTDVVGMP